MSLLLLSDNAVVLARQSGNLFSGKLLLDCFTDVQLVKKNVNDEGEEEEATVEESLKKK